MKNENIKVEKVSRDFYKNGFIQASVMYNNAISIISNEDNLIYHYKEGSKINFNSHTDLGFSDENLDKKNVRVGLKKCNVTNQVFREYTLYFVINDGKVEQYYVLPNQKLVDGQQGYVLDKDYPAYLIKEELPYDDIKTKYMNRLEVEQLFARRDNEQLFILNDNGGIYEIPDSIREDKFIIPSETAIVSRVKRNNIEKIDSARRKLILSKKNNERTLNELRRLKEYYTNLSIDNIDTPLNVYDNDLITIRLKKEGMEIKDMFVKLVGPNKYKVQIMNIPIRYFYDNEIINSNKKRIRKNKVICK